jgi:putative NADPH-quinone reductase
VKALVVHAHPDPDSFSAHLFHCVRDGLEAAGHEHRSIDLYEEGFTAAMSEEEWRLHRETHDHKPWTSEHHALLEWADTIVWVYPTWWSGPPAILKGWVDRVWTNGIAYEHTEKGLIPGPLTHIRRMVVVTTHGSSRIVNMLEGDVGKKMIRRTLRALCGWRCRTRWLAMYDLDRSTPSQRMRFATRVRGSLSR